MKLAIITWCNYHNFGTFLQVYALQTFLKNNGYDAKIIDDYKFSVKQPFLIEIKIFLKKFIKQIYFHFRLKNDNMDKISVALYDLFKQKYLDVDYDVKSLQKLNKRYESYICGSDQIWNPGGFARKDNDFYFASFTKSPKIAYAPSIGVKEIPDEYKKHFTQLISDFSFLSMREHTAAKVLMDICGKTIETVVDPTLLLDRQDWYKLVDICTNNQKYVFVYFLTYNQAYINQAREYANKHGLKLRIVKPCGVKMPVGEMESAGPIEFLRLISEASFVMTDSFHAVIFSIIYKKQFVVFKRFKDTDKDSQNSRIENFLSMIKLPERLIGKENLQQINNNIHNINFDEVDMKLNNFISNSKNYLLSALKAIGNGRS